VTRFTIDINFIDAFEESKHPRGQPGNKGEFGPGGGSNKELIQKDIKSLNRMMSSSAASQDIKEKTFFQRTVKADHLVLYRGVSVIPNHHEFNFSKDQMNLLKSLKPGDEAPDFLVVGRGIRNYASFTKKKSVASSYSKGGLEIVIEVIAPKKEILVDLENLPSLLKDEGIDHDFDEDDFNYFKRDKEVFVSYPLKNARIVSIKNTLR
jgi:hypothetical protein